MNSNDVLKEGKRTGDTIINHVNGCVPNQCVVICDLMRAKNRRIKFLVSIILLLLSFTVYNLLTRHVNTNYNRSQMASFHSKLDSLNVKLDLILN